MERRKRITASFLVTGVLLTGAHSSESQPQFVPTSSWEKGTNESEESKGTKANLLNKNPIVTRDYNVLVGAGDIARCDNNADEKTAKLIKKIPGVVFTAGDNVYQQGGRWNFKHCYDPSWGDFKWRTKPVIGNHDTYPKNSHRKRADRNYHDYFGKAAGPRSKDYYSYDMDHGWHIVALNSNNGWDNNSKQAKWLQKDLEQHKNAHIAAIWHHPLFTCGEEPGTKSMRELWKLLDRYDVKLVINGHAHSYQRFAAQTPDGKADPNGIREFVVGTGGARLKGLHPCKNLEVGNNKTYGVTKFTLFDNSYSWEFIPAKGYKFKDSGSQNFNNVS